MADDGESGGFVGGVAAGDFRPLTRARELGETREKGVAEMVRTMANGEWVPGSSTIAFAERFGIAVGTAKDWAGEASRQLRALAATDREELREVFVSRLARLEALALTKQAYTMKGEPYDAPDLRTAVAAVAEQAKLLGLVTQKVDVTARTEQLTDEQIQQRLAELGYQKRDE